MKNSGRVNDNEDELDCEKTTLMRYCANGNPLQTLI